MACYPWIVSHEKQGQRLEDYPAIKQWFEKIRARTAVVEAYAEGERLRGGQASTVTPESKQFLFGQKGDHLK
jgi:GST-like protein